MNIRPQIRNVIIEIICMLYVLLFVYAAASKLMDFKHFRIQIGQSPLLSAFADWLAVLVPAAEFLICIMLIIPRYRLTGLFSAYALMVMFSEYIFILLNYTSFIPCSCGGVLEKLDWGSHMIFNLVFVCLAIIGILLQSQNSGFKRNLTTTKKLAGVFLGLSISAIGVVVALFMTSENIIHYHNKLTRRFPQSPVQQIASKDLKLNSYYIAGVDDNNIYLGNSTAPLLLTTLNSNLVKKGEKMIHLDRMDLAFKGIRILVSSPYFFVADGTVPCIFKGKISDWKAFLVHKGGEYFTSSTAVDSISVVVVTTDRKTGDNVLGIINTDPAGATTLNPHILQKQFDGVFDTDGYLLYSKAMRNVIYLYAYRNQLTIADRNLNIVGRSTTIDTISQAKLEIAIDSRHGQRQFSKPPLFVNKNSAVYSNMLFVHSAIPGRYEDDRIWKETSIIDVYDLRDKSYVLSFPINNMEGKKVKSFTVHNNVLYALIGTSIIAYRLDSRITSKYMNENE